MPESTALDVFASNFRALSSRANLTQAQLAEITGASQSTVGTWLRGEQSPGVIELARLCRHFGVSGDHMLGLSEFPSGLAPDSWIVDLDEPANPNDPNERWAVKVPRRHRIVTWKELEAMRAEIEERKRRKPHKGG